MKQIWAMHPEPKLWEQTAKIDDYPQPYLNLQWDTTIANYEHTVLPNQRQKKNLLLKTNTGQASCQVNRCGRTSHMTGMLRVIFFVFFKPLKYVQTTHSTPKMCYSLSSILRQMEEGKKNKLKPTSK